MMTELIHCLEQTDTQAFLFLNGFHCHFWDTFMFLYSGRFIWIPLYAAFLYVMFRNHPWRSCVACLLTIALLVVLCDQTSSGLLKPLVGRLRPANPESPIAPLVHVVNGYRGGRYGFPSSHSANCWGLTFFALYLVRNRKLTMLLVPWALVMTYSRIYLGVHYPGDLLVGFVIGFIMATLCYYGFKHCSGKHAECFRSDTIRKTCHAAVPFAVALATLAVMLVISIIQ